MALPGVIASKEGFAFSVDHKGKAKGFLWVWMERIDPKKPRVPQPKVLAARVASQADKAALLAADPDKFFTEPHYNGFPAVLVRLPSVTEAELGQVITEAWRCMAPRPLVAAYDAGGAAPALEPAHPVRRPPAATPTALPSPARRSATPTLASTSRHPTKAKAKPAPKSKQPTTTKAKPTSKSRHPTTTKPKPTSKAKHPTTTKPKPASKSGYPTTKPKPASKSSRPTTTK